MALTTLPGQVGYKAFRYSSMDGEAMAKFTDKNHLERLVRFDAPTEYDRGVIDIWTQTSLESNDFIDMINKSEPFYIDNDTWSWDVQSPYEFPKLIEIPDTTNNNPTPGIDGQTFDLVFDSNYFQVNDTITADYIYGDKLFVTSGPHVYNAGWLYSFTLIGSNVTKTTSVNRTFLTIGQTFDKVDNIIGEFDSELSGLNKMGDKIKMYQSLSAGYGVTHSVTKWAEGVNLRDSKGRPLDIIVYDQYKRNARGQEQYVGSAWEPYVERMMRNEMMKIRKHRMLYGSGGEANTLAHRQENKKASEGIIHQMRNYGNRVEYNAGDFNLNIIRDTFGDLFYRRVPMEQRRVKLYTNEAGMKLFQQANKDDLMASGLTIVADSRFIEGSGRTMRVNYAFDSAYTMETGVIEVAHLMELDQPNLNSSYGQNKYSTPIFIAFDISNEGEGLQRNIREVRRRGQDTMTWGYVDGRISHLGMSNSKGMNSANMNPYYQIWMEDRSDIFIEDLSKTVIIEQVPQF